MVTGRAFPIRNATQHPGLPDDRRLWFGNYLSAFPDQNQDGADELLVGSLGEGEGPQLAWLFLSE